MFDVNGTEEDFSDVVQVGNPWHGLAREETVPTLRIVTGSYSGFVRAPLEGDTVTGPSGTGVVVEVPSAGGYYVRPLTGAFAVADVIAIAGAFSSGTISQIDATTHTVFSVLTDTGAIDHLLYVQPSSESANHLPGLAWKFTRPGVGPAPATPSDEIALGMLWKNYMLAPGEFGWRAGQHLNPLVDDSGNVWIVAGVSVIINPDHSGNVTLTVIMQDSLVIGEPSLDYETITTTFPVGGVPAGIDTLGGDASARLCGIKDQGRTWLYCVEGGNLPTGHLGGIFEVDITGTGVYDPFAADGGRFSGLAMGITVLKTYTQCTWVDTVVADSYIQGPTLCSALPQDPPGVDTTYTQHGTRTLVKTRSRVVSAFYSFTGTVLYPELLCDIDYYGSSTCTFRIYGGYCTLSYSGTGVPFWSFFGTTNNFDAVSVVDATYIVKLRLGSSVTPGITYHMNESLTQNGNADGSGSQILASLYEVDGVVVTSGSISKIAPAGTLNGCPTPLDIIPSDSFLDSLGNGVLMLRHGTDMGSRSSVYLGIRHPAANIVSLVVAFSGTVNPPMDPSDWASPQCPHTGALVSAPVLSGRIDGYASPVGISAGTASVPISGSLGTFACTLITADYAEIKLQALHPDFAAYNPDVDTVSTALPWRSVFV